MWVTKPNGGAVLRRPVIILGAARSGTTLLARIFGSSDEVFLITEVAPHLKARNCPEDRSGVSDAELWRRHFTFGRWQVDKPRPVCERPILDSAKLASMRARYLQMAGAKRLVIKNPLSLARVDMLKSIFPDALFVFSLRAPWPTIQSATLKGNASYIVPTEFVNSLPDNLTLRAAATWAESTDVLMRERDSNWIVVRHEELIARPYPVIAELYDRAGLAQVPMVAQAARLPETRVRDYSFIKYHLMGHPYRAEIFSLLERRAHAFGYDANLSALPGSGLRYAAGAWISQLQPRKPKSRPRKGYLLGLA
jgi:sulfotransferase family protein